MQQNITKNAVENMNKLKSGAYKENTGWLDLEKVNLTDIKQTAEKVRDNSEVLVVIGTGGSFLGSKAVIEALSNPFKRAIEVMYLGNDLSSLNLKQSLEYLKHKNFSVNFISKSGSTLEPNIAFSLIKKLLIEKYYSNFGEKIFITTSLKEGTLIDYANEHGIKTFHIPEDVGGRFSVFTPAGLFPIAVAGFDVESLLEGAISCREELFDSDVEENNDAIVYSSFRKTSYNLGKKIEVFSVTEPRLKTFGEWWKQLFGESEGKGGKGLFPSVAVYPTDLHSLGQYLQEGPRIMIETFFVLENSKEQILLEENGDLSYLDGIKLSEVSSKSTMGTISAHQEGGVECSVFTVINLNEKTLGNYMFFFMLACSVSAMLLDVNPFDQPGVEAYKKNVTSLLKN